MNPSKKEKASSSLLPPTPEPSMASGTDTASSRARRAANFSDNSTSSSEAHRVSPTKFRVGVPALHDLPLYGSTSRDEIERLRDKHSNAIEHAITSICKKYGIQDQDVKEVEAADRYSPGTPEKPFPTIVIVARWESEKSATSWPQIVIEAKHAVDTLLSNSEFSHLNMYIEMVAPELFMPLCVAPVSERPDLDEKWPSIQTTVSEILDDDNYIQGRWNCIHLLRLGYGQDTENPITVYIAVKKACSVQFFDSIAQSLAENISKKFSTELDVFIEHKEIKSLAFQLLEPPRPNPDLYLDGAYERKINLGADISVSRYITGQGGSIKNSHIGTLGCYLEIQTQGNNTWTRYALTNYHVVRAAFDGLSLDAQENLNDPPPDSPLAAVDAQGFGPKGITSSVVVESPSRAKHNHTVQNYNRKCRSRLQNFDKKALKKELQQKVEFFDDNKQVFGSLFCGSGFTRRTADNALLDWALIQVESPRQGENSLATGGRLDVASYLDPRPLTGFYASLENASEAYIVGAISGFRQGEYSKHKAACQIGETKHLKGDRTREACFFPSEDKPFAVPGDSGAIVFNEERRVLGIVTRGIKPGNERKDNMSLVYVTPINDVLEDIKVMLQEHGVAVKSIRIAPKPE